MSKFKIWKTDRPGSSNARNDRWYWHLKARNGRIICSGQSSGYASKHGAEKGIRAVVKASCTHVVWKGMGKYRLYLGPEI